jgi:tRNA/rRNA methyltransferase
VVIVAYEWFKLTSGGALPFAMPQKSQAAPRQQLLAFFANLERELEKVEFFRPPDKRETMQINLRNIFSRMQPTQQDIQTLSGVIMAIAEGRKGPARGGVLDGEEAGALRALLAEHDHGRVPGERGPVRGLSRLLRRNPTDAERALWEALTRDRRFSGMFKRQTPIGPHINDFVSFQQRLVIDVVPPTESEAAAQARAERHDWLREHNYRVVAIGHADLARDLTGVLDSLGAALSGPL